MSVAPVLEMCSLVHYTGKPKTCVWCGEALPKRRLRWCSDTCVNAYTENHWWSAARAAALRRDGWTCLECGRIGWADVPRDVLVIERDDRFEGRPPYRLGGLETTALDDWALAVGLLARGDWRAASWLIEDREAAQAQRQRVRAAIDALPESIHELITEEQRMAREASNRRQRLWGAVHDLEVDHIRPIRGGERHNVCLNHLDNLRTLCRPCHRDVTRLQIVSARSRYEGGGGGTRTIACWEQLHERCWAEDDAGCSCLCHAPLGDWHLYLESERALLAAEWPVPSPVQGTLLEGAA